MARKIELYDQKSNYYYGQIKDHGNIELYNTDNDYYHGKLKPDGNLYFYDRNSKYYYGKVKAGDKLEVYTPDGEYWTETSNRSESRTLGPVGSARLCFCRLVRALPTVL